jgi:ribosomal protein S18 acetylase RimI-like enzyme
MAVERLRQGEGFGRMLMTGLLQELCERGVEVAWANGRDTAQGFYEAMGFTIVQGSAHLSPSTGLPHHRIYKVVSEDTAP